MLKAAALVFAAFIALSAALVLWLADGPSGDFNTLLRLYSFKYTGLPGLTANGRKALYLMRCVGVCHGNRPVETVRHTSSEWRAVIERMRTQNRASINEREAAAIGAYLQKEFGSNVPTLLSPEAERFIKRRLWMSDFGDDDIFIDVIYAPLVYFRLTGEEAAGVKYEAEKRTVFKVYVNTHQGRLGLMPLDSMAVLKYDNGEEIRPVDWSLAYESADAHHIEGTLRFYGAKKTDTSMTLTLRGVSQGKDRSFHWHLPVTDADIGNAAAR